MRPYRQKLVASLCLLAAALTLIACSVLVRPEPAAAARSAPRQFVFGPIPAGPNRLVRFQYFNSTTRPTPQATVVIREGLTGEQLLTDRFPEIPPGQGNFTAVQAPNQNEATFVVFLTFDHPAAGQAIPNPFPSTLAAYGANGEVEAVLYAR